MRSIDVIAIIHAAFDDAMRPDDTLLLHPECCDDSDINAFYGVRRWQDVPSSVLERENAALCFFSPAAFRFFLPAFLVWVVQNHCSNNAFTVSTTIYALDPGSPANAFKMSKLDALSPRQREAVVAFLQFMGTAGERLCDANAVRAALHNLERVEYVRSGV